MDCRSPDASQHRGEVVAEIDAADADEAALLRAAHNLGSEDRLPEEIVAEEVEEAQAHGIKIGEEEE